MLDTSTLVNSFRIFSVNKNNNLLLYGQLLSSIKKSKHSLKI